MTELHNRLDRCENYLKTDLAVNDRLEEVDIDMADTKEGKTHVYRDKNTLVEVTVHTRGRSKETNKNTNVWNQDLEKKESFARPTRASSSKTVVASPKNTPRKKSFEKVASKKQVDDENSAEKQKSIRELMEELRVNFKKSGIKDFYDFLDEVDSGKASQGGEKVATTKKLIKKSDNRDEEVRRLQEEGRRLGTELTKYKSECARYKTEYENVIKQLKINKENQLSLETQIADLKRIVSRLTHNNSELLLLVGEKAGEEESLSGVRQKLSVVERQLGSERGRVRDYEERFLEQENEIGKLRKLTADLKTHLHHELAGLDLPRSRPASLPQDKTSDILGLTAMSNVFKGSSKSNSDDSAIEDPESRRSSSSRTVSKKGSKKEENVARVVQPGSSLLHGIATLPSQIQQHPPPTAFRANLPPRYSEPRAGKELAPENVSEQPQRLAQSQSFLPPQTNANPLKTSFVPPLNRSADAYSNSIAPLTTTSDRHSTLITPQTSFAPIEQTCDPLQSSFHPLPLDLSDTVSSSGVTGAYHNLTQTDIKHQIPPAPEEEKTEKTEIERSLENKVQAFLNKLHQDSLNLSIPEPPKARSFQGPSMQLSLSGNGSELDDTRDTTLTEGKFLRGLETSIEVLPAELTQSSN